MEHEHGCGCGHHHHGHDHNHNHDRDHGERWGCGCDALSEEQRQMLRTLAESGSGGARLPAANFVMASSASPHCQAVALPLVLLDRQSDTLQDVRDRSALLSALVDRHLVMFRDDIAVCEHIQQAYRESEVFRYFEDSVREGGAMPGFLFDTPLLQMGGLCLTELGERALEG